MKYLLTRTLILKFDTPNLNGVVVPKDTKFYKIGANPCVYLNSDYILAQISFSLSDVAMIGELQIEGNELYLLRSRIIDNEKGAVLKSMLEAGINLKIDPVINNGSITYLRVVELEKSPWRNHIIDIDWDKSLKEIMEL